MSFRINRICGIFGRSPITLTLAEMSQSDVPLVMANERFPALAGYGAWAMFGRNCRFLQRLSQNTAARDEVRETMAAGAQLQVVFHDYREDGGLLFLHTMYVVDRQPHRYLGSQLKLTPAPQDALVGRAKRRGAKLQEVLLRLTVTTERRQADQRCHLADAAASLASIWRRAR